MLKKLLVAIALIALISGCATSETQNAKSAAPEKTAAAKNNKEFYEVHQDGRIYTFYDADTYKEFLAVGETAYRKTYIGTGPNGETLVYGLTKADKKKTSGIPSIDMVEGRLEGSEEDFYAEIRKDGRIYVFDDWKEVETFRSTGEAAYRLTQIGAGPQGETVVYVLTKEKKKEYPEAMIQRFEAFYKA